MQLSELHHKARHTKTGWHILIAVLATIILQFALNDNLTLGTKYPVIGLEIILLLVLAVFNLPDKLRRLLALGLITVISFANIISLIVVIVALFGNLGINGHELLASSVAIYMTNIIVFGLWYWELDNTRQTIPDFLFAQQANSQSHQNWKPTFFDYLYVSVTNATAFSPTDTLPLTHRAKLLMLIQSITSLVTVALVVARAVNILS